LRCLIRKPIGGQGFLITLNPTEEGFQLHQRVEEGYNASDLPLWICYWL